MGTNELTAPLPFALLTLVFASLLGTLADISLGVDKPFFELHSYYMHYQTFGHCLKTFQKALPSMFSASIILHSLKFTLVIMVILIWARALAGSTRRYWADASAFSYLLQIFLIVEILEYCAVNLTFRIIGEKPESFLGVTSLISILSAFIIYGIILKVVDQVYYVRAWRRVLHVIGYLIVVPVLIFILNAVFYFAPVRLYAYVVIRPTMAGDAKLDKGDYEAAEKLFIQAIKNDVTGMWSSHAHIRLVSVNARRILALLPNILGDAGIHDRMLRKLAQTDPFRQVINVFREGSINVTHLQLIEFRETILRSFLTTGEIPVTDSELDRALRSTEMDDDRVELPNDLLGVKANTPAQRRRLSYLIYRARALRGEPTTADARRYLQFLLELPIRIEVMFVRYRALNLARDSETLAYLDDRDRFGYLDREYLVKGNREILDKGYKFPHLMMPDAGIDKLSDRELGFHLRQAYLNYLRDEVRLLATSPFGAESSLIQQQATSIEERLNLVARDPMYLSVSK